MPSKTSLFNKEMVLQVNRSIGWISIIYFLGLFFALPLRILMSYLGDQQEYFTPVRGLFAFDFGIQIILFVSVPVILAVFLFRFLHVKQAADLMHSLPLKREKIFHFYTLTGWLFLILPVVAISVITSIIHLIYDLNLYFQLEDIAVWAGTVILFNTVFYLAGVFVAMVTGISAVQGVLTYIMLLFPAGFTMIVVYSLGMMLYGFPSDFIQAKHLENMSPITHLVSMESGDLTLKAILLYAVLLLIFYPLSLLVYKKRKIESASEAISFHSLKIVFKYGVAFCTMLLGGMYFDAMQHQMGWLMFGYALGGIIGYFAAEMVLQKSWRVFGRLRGLGIFAAAMVILVLIIQSLTPYEKRVPDLDEIKNVTFTNGIYYHSSEEHSPQPLNTKENIAAVRELHKEIIRNEKKNEMDMRFQERAVIIYEMNNGSKVIRQYTIDTLDYEPKLKEIYESVEYKHATDPIFQVKPNRVTSIRITDGLNDSLFISKPDEISEFFSLLKKEVEKDSFDPGYYQRGNRSNIEIKVNYDKYIHVDLKASYKDLIAWLKKKNMLEQAMVTSDDVEYILVTDEMISKEELNKYPENELVERLLSSKNTIKLTDKNQIETALDNAGYGWFDQEPYTAVFVYAKGDYKEIRTFNDKYVPEFIKEHFKR